MIVYDGDADRIYSFTDFDKALASIEGSVRGYFGAFGEEESNPDFDVICAQVTDKMRELQDSPCIPMKFNNLRVVVYNWEIDNANPLHKVLTACYDAVPDLDIKGKIEKLFSPSVR